MASFLGVSNEPLGYPTGPFGSNALNPFGMSSINNGLGMSNIVGAQGGRFGNVPLAINPLSASLINPMVTTSVLSPRLFPSVFDDDVPTSIITPAMLYNNLNPRIIPRIPATNYYNYLDINYDPELRNTTVKFFKKKIIDWLLNDYEYRRILNYFVIRTDSKKIQYVDSIRNASEYVKDNNDTSDQIKTKVKFIVKYILSKQLVAKMLEKYGEKSNVKWWNFKNNVDDIKSALARELRRKIKSTLMEEIAGND